MCSISQGIAGMEQDDGRGGKQIQPLSTPVFPIGPVFRARGDLRKELERIKRYRFTAIRGGPVDVADEVGIKVVTGIGWWSLPSELRKPCLSNRGEWRSKLGFLDVNFNYPPFRQWLKDELPSIIRKTFLQRRNLLSYCIHNEFAYWAPGFYDYSEWTVERYRQWLKERYGEINALNLVWRTAYKSFEEIEPPRELPTKELANWIEWRIFTCYNFSEFFKFIADIIHSVQPDVPVSSNFCFTSSLDGWNLFELARLNDLISLDIYALSRWDLNAFALELLRSAAKAYNRPHHLWEYHAGPNNWIPKVTADHIYVSTFQALARSIRCIIYYHWAPANSGVERGIHGMCDTKQEPTERVTAASEMASECQRLSHLLLKSQTPAKVAVLYSVPAIFYAVGTGKDAWSIINRYRNIARLLERIHVPFDLVEERQLKRLSELGYKVLILDGTPLLSKEDGEAVLKFVRNGGSLISFSETAIADAYGFEYEHKPGILSEALGIKSLPSTEAQRKLKRIIPTKLLTEKCGIAKPIACEAIREIASAVSDGVTVMATTDDEKHSPVMTVNRYGKGKAIWVGCEFRVQDEKPADEALCSLMCFLLSEAGAPAPIQLTDSTGSLIYGDVVEAYLSQADGNLMIWLIRRVERDVGEVKVKLSNVDIPSKNPLVLAIYAGKRKVERLRYEVLQGSIAFKVPQVSPATLVIIAHEMQPLIGLDAPEYVVSGVPFTASVTVDNTTTSILSVSMDMVAPHGWRVERVGKGSATIKPSERAVCAFRITPPTNASIERFRLENVLTAIARFKAYDGNGWKDIGELKCEQGVGIVPAVDLLVRYKGELLNPWQELSPPILRWGWGTDVFVKQVPTLPVDFDAKVEVEAIPHIKKLSGKVGKQIVINVRPENGLAVTPTQIKMSSDGGKALITVHAKHPSRYTLTLEADYGTGKTVITFPVTANVEQETLTKHLQSIVGAEWHGNFKRRLPFAVAVFSSLLPPRSSENTQIPAKRFAVANVDCDERPDSVTDANGRPIPFLWRDRKLLLAVEQKGYASIATGFAYFDGDAKSSETLVKFKRTDRTISFAFPTYTIQFDAFSGAVTGIRLSEGEQDIVTNACLVLTHSQRRWQKRQDASHIVSSVDASINAVEGSFKAKGIIGSEGEFVEYTQVYTILPDRVGVSITIRNPQSSPLRIGEVAYEISRRYKKTEVGKGQNGTIIVEAERRPPQFLHADFRDISYSDGSGFGVLLLYCQYRWGESFAGFRSGVTRTTISLGRNIILDPGEAISARFDIVPHATSIDASMIAPAECVAIVGEMQKKQ
ncbi:MAG: hypothetical protein RUDDFDWM_002000 [Candidatus Fervidibacterota bacterium]